MKKINLGYACVNTQIGCTCSKTFRLASYSTEKFIQTTRENLDCLQNILVFNQSHHINYFRISSDIIPFASHPIQTVPWQVIFNDKLVQLGSFIKKQGMRVTMHPDQFVVINSPNPEVVANSISELEYHVQFLDALNLDNTHKVQIHVGGVYQDKVASIKRFIKVYHELSQQVKKRLVIENDERSYSLKDCLEISKHTDIPVVFDIFHHTFNNSQESSKEALDLAKSTWKDEDGNLMVDYSEQKEGGRPGAHSETINTLQLKEFLYDLVQSMDIMLEVKDKEQSVLKLQY